MSSSTTYFVQTLIYSCHMPLIHIPKFLFFGEKMKMDTVIPGGRAKR